LSRINFGVVGEAGIACEGSFNIEVRGQKKIADIFFLLFFCKKNGKMFDFSATWWYIHW